MNNGQEKIAYAQGASQMMKEAGVDPDEFVNLAAETGDPDLCKVAAAVTELAQANYQEAGRTKEAGKLKELAKMLDENAAKVAPDSLTKNTSQGLNLKGRQLAAGGAAAGGLGALGGGGYAASQAMGEDKKKKPDSKIQQVLNQAQSQGSDLMDKLQGGGGKSGG